MSKTKINLHFNPLQIFAGGFCERSQMKTTYLVMVDANGNHNKYYKMLPGIPSAEKFSVEYGRVGSTPMKCVYSITDWNKKLKEKLYKGYTDQSELHDFIVTSVKGNGKYGTINDCQVSQLVDMLMRYANQYLAATYTINDSAVTLSMIDAARKTLKALDECAIRQSSVQTFNKHLLDLYQVLPRVMKNVNDMTAKSTGDFSMIVERENETLDVMASKVSQNVKTTNSSIDPSGKKTILEVLGIELRPCNDDEILDIKKHLGAESAIKFKSAFKVTNLETEKHFMDYVKREALSKKDIHFYFHGSRNENWWGILTQGLLINSHAIHSGSMFGHGLYFALRARKSIGYSSLHGAYWTNGTSNTGFLAIYKVGYKKRMDLHNHTCDDNLLNASSMQKKGYDATFAHKGSMLLNDEVIVYTEQQCTIQYLIELAA